MTKPEGQLFDNREGSAAFWQHGHNPAEYERQQPHKQANPNRGDSWTIFLGILFTIGFIVLLAVTTLRTML